MTLAALLEVWAVHAPGMWKNDDGPVDFWAVEHEDSGIMAYFIRSQDAYRFRLAEINRILNG